MFRARMVKCFWSPLKTVYSQSVGAAVDPCFERLGMHGNLFGEDAPALEIGGADHEDNRDDGGEEKPPGMAHTGIYMVARGRNHDRQTLQGARDQLRQQGRPVGDAVDQDAFMGGVRAFADRPQAVERRDAQRRGEVAVRSAAAGGFFEVTPSSAASARAVWNNRRTPAERSIGGRFKPPVTSIAQRLSNGFRDANWRSRYRWAAALGTRTSTSTWHSAAMTLLRVPPWMTPGLTVIPASSG